MPETQDMTAHDAPMEPECSIAEYEEAQQAFMNAVQAYREAIDYGTTSGERRAKREVLEAKEQARDAVLKVVEAELKIAKAKGEAVRKFRK